MLSLFQRLLLGGLLLLTLITGLSFLVRNSFVSLNNLDTAQAQMDHALSALAIAQGSVAREQILVERSLLNLPSDASTQTAAPTDSVAGTPPESVILVQSERARDRLLIADHAMEALGDSPRLGQEIASHNRVLARLRHVPPERAARMESARMLEPVDQSLRAKLDALRDRHTQAVVNFTMDRESLRAKLIGACAACILTAIAVVAACLFYVLHPLRTAARMARRMGQGELQYRIPWQVHDDLGTVATEFNRMAIRLRDLLETESGRRAMEQQLSDAVVQSIFEPVIVTDGRGQLLRLNTAARELLGDAAADRMALSSTPGGDKILSAIHAAVTMQGSATTEGDRAMVPVRMGRGQRNYRLRTSPMRDNEGHLLGAVSVLEDVTELQDLDRFKTRFLAVASRKLRDPLEKLRVALHALAHGYAGEMKPLQAEVIEGAQKEAADLDDLMADLFAVAELESGNRTLRLEQLRPLDMLREAQASNRQTATKKNIEMFLDAYGDLQRVQADRRAMRSIFENLLSNAVQHTPEGGIIRLIARESKGFVQFSVSDTGQGIPAERLPSIFGRFNSRESDGTALGLALVRRLVESHGGQVSVESRIGTGSTFSFTLPVVAPQESRHPVEAG